MTNPKPEENMRNFKITICFEDDSKDIARLSPEEIREALRTSNAKIIGDAFAIAQELNRQEIARTSVIDSKAENLFTPIGLLASAFFWAATKFSANKSFERLSFIENATAISTIVLYLFFLVLAGLFLYRTVRVSSKFRAPDEQDIINGIRTSEESTGQTEPEKEIAANIYRRRLIEHYWRVNSACFDENEFKSKSLLMAQRSFLAAATILLFAAGSILVSTPADNTSEVGSTKSTELNTDRPSKLQVLENAQPRDFRPMKPLVPPVLSTAERPPPTKPATGGRPISNGSEDRKVKSEQ